jgi:hypothetical protein
MPGVLNLPAPSPASDALDLGWSALRTLFPNLTDPRTYQPLPPPAWTPTPEGKLPSSDRDPRVEGAAGDLVNLALMLAPLPGLGAGAAAARWLRRLAESAAPRTEAAGESLASRSVSLYNAPVKPPRPFATDYPQGAAANASGRLTQDIEGRPLGARYIAGRTVVGGADEAIPATELDALGQAITGSYPENAPKSQLGIEAGRYTKRRGDRLAGDQQQLPGVDGFLRRILFRDDLRPEQAQNVVAHEIAHAIEDRAGTQTRYLRSPSGEGVPFGALSDEGIKRELGQVYHDLNDRTWRRGQPTAPRLQTKPEDFGYRGDDVRAEKIAEAIRAI